MSTVTNEPIAPFEAPTKHRVNGRTKVAIDLMVWEGARRDDAALKAGITIGTMRNALRAPHVKAYYREQLEVLRESERAKNVHRAIAIRDAADNMPAMHAIKWLEGEQDQILGRQHSNAAQSPGVTFVIVQQGTAAPMRDVTPVADPVLTRRNGNDE